MTEKLNILTQKIDEVLSELQRLQNENKQIISENHSLKNEVTQLNQILSKIQLNKSDDSDRVRSRLQSVLQRVEELESLSS